ncbi:MAG: hypothetical protein COB14_00535 [Alphaproteobacteria bacterium]|nr:MAG: hypothetical protein COB14_00535 [Alphaproteobacteria bacterium]
MLCERLKIFLVLFVMVLLVFPSASHAVCSSPTGVAGEMGFDLTGTGQMEYCNDTSWVEAGAIAPVVAIEPNMNAALVGHWRLDETSGSTITDSSGSGNGGTWSDNVNADVAEETVAGKLGTSIHFDGTDDYVTIADNAALSGGTNATLTWSFWFNPDSIPAGEAQLLTKSLSSENKDWEFAYKDGQTVRFYYENGSGNDAPCRCDTISTFNTGEWNLITATYDGNTNALKMYVNGVLESTFTLTYDLPDTTGSVQIGQRSYAAGVNNFDGDIDDVRIYDRVLTSTEIAYLYASTKDLVGHWTLDETSGTSVTEYSGNGNTGTFIGEAAVVSADGKIDTALTFDNSNDYVSISADATINDVFTGGGTIMAWIYPETYGEGGNYGRILAKASGGSDGWHMHMDGGTGEAFAFSVNCVAAGNEWWRTNTGTLQINEWSHVAVSMDTDNTANTPTMYVNGESVSYTSTGSCTTFSSDSAENLLIGNMDNTARTFDGQIDDARIYGGTLSASEIKAIYQQTQNYGLVGHWKLDETSGTSIADSSGNGNTGTFSGEAAVVSVAGKIDTALSFDGSDDYIGINDDDTLDFGTGDFSFAAWVNVPTSEDCSSAGDGETFIGQRDSSRPHTYLACHVSDQYATFTAKDSDDISISSIGNTPLNDGVWHHVAGVKEGHSSAIIYIYVDGVLQNSTAGSFTGDFNYNVATPTSIGRFNVSPYYNVTAVIDEARMYNRALSASEIAQLSICTKPGEMGYNFGAHVLQWCDVVLDVYNAGTAGAGGGGCAAAGTKVAGVEGGYQYDTTSNKMVFCDGASWVDIPN